ncbi:Protein of unknown function [Evansella caseinilytica]|uniref:DUF2627 domain-containing protein n=1 Tax=Evansella caseinilytica TaxID=1503961 RepID=A0A1H3KYA6_9BACI|nr:DUF2627 domain-containing protein [Evansella caseinilytica]SDY57142.1 Protein of unknown function [Evansella caseinilytica]
MTIQRFIALCILLVPVFTAGYGIKLMRDALFYRINWPFDLLWLQFVVGMGALVIGVWLIGGFIFYRDKKNGKVAPRFKKTN